MRSRPLQVVVEDRGADACLYAAPDEPVRVLYLRPGQSVESAVKAVQAALGDDDDELARSLVKKHLPDAMGLEEMVAEPSVPVRHPWSGLRAMLWVVGVTVVVLLMLVAWALLQAGVADEFHNQYIERPRHPMSGAFN